MTFTFASDKITDQLFEFWLNEKNRTCQNSSLYYDIGFMKAAYGSFIEGLDVIYCNDMVADIAAESFNITWNRTSPMVMSVHDDIAGTVLSGESSFYFGRTAYGNPDDVKAFYFACSASFSPLEHYVGHALFPNNGNNDSATIGLGFILDNGSDIEIIQDGNLTLIREVGSNEKVLLFDSTTGLLRDQIIAVFNGAYCYSSQQADWGCEFGQNILNAKDDIWNFVFNNSVVDGWNNDVLGILGSIGMSVGIACLPAFPVGTAIGLGLIGFGLYSTYYANDLNKGLSIQRLTNFGIDVSLSVIPVAGTELKVGSTIGKLVLTKGDLELSVIKLSSKKTNIFVNYILDNFGFDGYSLIGQEGIKYTYTKFGTIESIIKTAYNGVDKFEVLNNFWQNYFISLFFKESVNNIFNILNIQ